MSDYIYMKCPFCGAQDFASDYTLRHTGWHGCAPELEITHFDEIGLVEQCEAEIVWGDVVAGPDCTGLIGCECGGPHPPQSPETQAFFDGTVQP